MGDAEGFTDGASDMATATSVSFSWEAVGADGRVLFVSGMVVPGWQASAMFAALAAVTTTATTGMIR